MFITRADSRIDRAAAPEPAADPEPQSNVGELVQRQTSAQADGRDGSKWALQLAERRLQPEREQDDPCHHRQVQV